MNLNQAHKKFATVPVDGWDGTSWTTDAAFGSMEVYSRFITERTFGVVKRLFMMPQAMDRRFTVMRMPDGTRYMIANEAQDFRNRQVYGYTYLLQEVIDDAKHITFTTQPSASGMGRDTLEVESDPIPCYYERYGAADSTEVDAVTYARTRILLPRGHTMGVDDEIEISGRRFSIKEVDLELELSRAFGMER